MRLLKNKNNKGHKSGFTIIELLVVIAITVLLLGVGLGGLISSQKTILFSSSYENVLQIVRDARSQALAGRALPDYTNYAQKGTSNLVTPANIGVNFTHNGLTHTATVTMFADLHRSSQDVDQVEGEYDPPPPTTPVQFYTYTPGSGNDVLMSQYILDSRLTLIQNFTGNLNFSVSIFFSPIFGDVKFNPDLPAGEKFFIFGVVENTGANARRKCAKIHPVSGVPETATKSDYASC